MKTLLLIVLIASLGGSSYAQIPDKIRTLFANGSLLEAKKEIDAWLPQENRRAIDRWYFKTEIYLAIAENATLSNTVPGARDTAFQSFKKYMEVEPKLSDGSHFLSTMDNHQQLISLYTGYSKEGAAYYNAGNYVDALISFKKTLEVHELLADMNAITAKMDTTTNLYAGMAAEKLGKPDEAAVYYSRLAIAKAKQDGFVEIYKWLPDYYLKKNDIARVQQFLALGKEVFPNDPFWNAFELEMLSNKGDQTGLWEKYEQRYINCWENPANWGRMKRKY
jgi:tetratricopeptide (TPR) repeat protein